MIRMGEFADKGRGVLAQKRFIKGELIERAPVIVIPRDQLEHLEKTILSSYVYSWGKDLEEGAIALGHGSLYNHAYHANADFVLVGEALAMDFIAFRDIEAGEEITINYNGLPDDEDPIWFDGDHWGFGGRERGHGPGKGAH